MNYPTFKFVFDRQKRATKTKLGLIQLEVYFQRKRNFLSTGLKVYIDEWKQGKQVVNRVDSMELNDRLNLMLLAANEYVRELASKNKPFIYERFVERMSKTIEGSDFLEFIETRTAQKKNVCENTRMQHLTLVRVLREFEKIRYTDDITLENIIAFDAFLHDRGLQQTTIANYHKRMKANINAAIKLKIMDGSPYENFKVDKGKNAKRVYLTEEEMQMVRNLETTDKRIERARDLFLFQCYTGLSYIDLMKIDYKKDIEVRKGKKLILARRQKTNEDYYIILLSAAEKILEKYDYEFPKISNQKYNDALKVVAMLSGIEKNITTHIARHTFAVWALNSGIHIEVVAKILGHKNIKTTEIYAKIVESSVEDAFDKLEEKLGR